MQLRKKALNMRNETGRIQSSALHVAQSVSHRELLTGTRASDIPEEPLLSRLQSRALADCKTFTFEEVAIGVRENRHRSAAGRKDGFVQAENENRLQIRIARTIYCSEQHLIEHGWNGANSQGAEATFNNRQPLLERLRVGAKCQSERFDPLLQLLPNREVHATAFR